MNRQLTTNNSPPTTIIKGYKNTEIGVIPEEWDLRELGDLTKLKNGYAFSSSFFSKTGPIVITPGNFNLSGGLKFNNKNTLRYSGNITNDMIFKNGDLIIVMTDLTPSCDLLGKPGIINSDEIIQHNQRIGKITVSSNDLLKDYLYRFFTSSLFSKRMKETATGSTVRHTSVGSIKQSKIPLPPLPEQTAIATVLSDTDQLLQALEKKIAKKRLIKKGAMQVLLAPPNNELLDELLGVSGKLLEDENDKLITNNSQLTTKKEGWVVKSLGEVANFRRGSFPQPYGLDQWYDENNGMPFVQVFDVDKNMKLKPTTKQKISDLAKDKSVFVKKGNIILTIQGSIGRIAVTQYDAYVDRTLLIFTEYKIPMDIAFFSFIVQEKFRIEKENAPGGIIKTITKEALSKFKMVFPKSLQEQTRIATILSDMDSEIAALEKQLAKYKQVKQGLMQVLLTGKIRLISG